MKSATSIHKVIVPIAGIELPGIFRIPEAAKGVVIFSHGSGSSHRSPRNNFVAEELEKKGFASLLIDLLTETEDENYEKRFDITLLTDRLCQVTAWAQHYKQIAGLPLGYFGASTGAASALKAAAQLGPDIKAIVSRGGRPDLALSDLHLVKSPTLLIVGDLDEPVIPLNQKAYDQLAGPKEISLVKGATHLFPEPGKLQEIADLAANWFNQYLP